MASGSLAGGGPLLAVEPGGHVHMTSSLASHHLGLMSHMAPPQQQQTQQGAQGYAIGAYPGYNGYR